MYDYKCKLNRAVDGDTPYLELDQGLDHFVIPFKARLVGLDCAKSSTPQGKLATAFVVDWFEKSQRMGDVICYTVQDKTEKYGRYLAQIVNAEGEVLNTALIENNLAVQWDGHGERPAEQ